MTTTTLAMPATYGIRRSFIFGVTDEKPKLPHGFRYIENPREFLMATDNERIFYVTKDKLILQRVPTVIDYVRTGFKLKPGKPYLDDRTTIQL